MSEGKRYVVVGRWIGEATDACTCHGAGPCRHEAGCGFEPLIKVEDAIEALLPAVKRQITRILDDAVTEFRDSQYRQIEFSPSQCIDFLRGVEAAKRLILEGGSLRRNFEIQRHPLMDIFPHLKEETPWVNQK